MGRPRKPIEKRVSGIHSAKSTEGKIALARMQYAIQKDGNIEIDTDAINAIIEGYIDDNSTTLHNRAGLRKKLKISRTTYNLYQRGYVSQRDSDAENVTSNDTLAEVIRAGDDAIIDEMIQNNDKSMQTKMIRILEGMGELAPQKKRLDVNVNAALGGWSKRAK